MAEERLKALIELALAAGRYLQSPQTGYIHYHYGSQESDIQHSIPLWENVLFALALFRSRTIENITEAKALLERLLIFQSVHHPESHGNFPIYLQDYPLCRDPLWGIHFLAPFYWILKSFGHILGQVLKQKLEGAIRALLNYSLTIHHQQPLNYPLAIRLAALMQAYGELWEDPNLKEQAEVEWQRLLTESPQWESTKKLSDLLISYQIVKPYLKNSSYWQTFWQYLSQTWHHVCHTYVGPCIKEKQLRELPQSTLYDLFLGYFSGQEPRREKKPQPYQLQAALIQPYREEWEVLPAFELEGRYKDSRWDLIYYEQGACTLLQKQELLTHPLEGTYTPFRLVWKGSTSIHTLVCQGGDVLVNYEKNFPFIYLFFDWPKTENQGKSTQGIHFYLDAHPDLKIEMDGHLATTFELGQTLTIQSNPIHLQFTFELIEGEGQFMGHLQKGNRSTQLDVKGDNRFNVYDWHFFIRALRRRESCRLMAKIQFLS